MEQKTSNLINGVFNIILVISWIILVYFVLNKKFCDEKEISFLWILLFILVNISFIILGIIILFRKSVKKKRK